MGDGGREKRKSDETLRAQLESERASFIPHWRDISEYLQPRRARFFVSDANRGDRRNQKIIDSTGTMALRTLAAGMTSGLTSPARPWFRLTTQDPDFAEAAAVKFWLHVVTQRMATVFLKSNLYNALPLVYKDLGGFGTAAMFCEEDFENVISFHVFPIGSYMIATNNKGRVDTFVRVFRMTVAQIIDKFSMVDGGREPDLSMLSEAVKNLWRRGQTQEWIDVCHVIRPNPEHDPGKLDARFKRYVSRYYEIGTPAGEDRYLRESGYDIFPVLCPRWEVTGEDVYGTSCPGMDALGDVKALQTMEKRALQAIEKGVNPPMVGPTSLRTVKATILPGDITHLNETGDQKFRPAHEVTLRLADLGVKQQESRERIRRAFFEDLFLMLALSDRREITAREVDERHEEKLLALGPVLEQLNQDLLDLLIDITFDFMWRQGQVPSPPEELQGLDLKVEYTSIMAQAQKLSGLSGLQRFSEFVIRIAEVKPDALDKVDVDQLVDEVADITGVPPRVVVPDEQLAAIRAERAQAQQAMQAMDNAKNAAAATKSLAQAPLEGDSALTRLLRAAEAGRAVAS